MLRGSFPVNTPLSRSRALLVSVSRYDQRLPFLAANQGTGDRSGGPNPPGEQPMAGEPWLSRPKDR